MTEIFGPTIYGRCHDLSTQREFNQDVASPSLIYRLRKFFRNPELVLDKPMQEAIDYIFGHHEDQPKYKCVPLKKIAEEFNLEYTGADLSVYADEQPIFAVMAFLTRLNRPEDSDPRVVDRVIRERGSKMSFQKETVDIIISIDVKDAATVQEFFNLFPLLEIRCQASVESGHANLRFPCLGVDETLQQIPATVPSGDMMRLQSLPKSNSGDMEVDTGGDVAFGGCDVSFIESDLKLSIADMPALIGNPEASKGRMHEAAKLPGDLTQYTGVS